MEGLHRCADLFTDICSFISLSLRTEAYAKKLCLPVTIKNNILVNKIAWDTTILRIFLYLNVHIQEQYRPFHCKNNNHFITEP